MSNPTLDEALALHAAGAYAEAERAYREILEARQDCHAAAHYLGVLLHQSGRSPDGVELIVRTLEAEPGVAARYNDLGNILAELGSLEDAAAIFELSLKLHPADANVWNNLGSVRHRLARREQAEAAYRAALDIDGEFAPALMNLAAILVDDGRELEGAEYWCRGFVQQPHDGKDPKLLATAYYQLGRLAEAAECYRGCLERDPDDAIAFHHFAACAGVNTPARASEAYVVAKFDEMAESFESKLLGKLDYRAPETIGRMLAGVVVADGALDVLDGGCGTGLCGPVLAPFARRLVGVDLSPAMLARAGERNVYHALVNDELCRHLARNPASFDVIAMADTVIYFGDLEELFDAAGRALRPGGLVALSAELAAAEPGYRLEASGRYSHTRRYLTARLAAAGFDVHSSEPFELRRELGRPVEGLGIVAVKVR